MRKQQPLQTLLLLALLCALAACGDATGNQAQTDLASTPATSISTPPPTLTNTISFTTTGQVSGSHTITSQVHTSKLRHGHKEFTIEVANAGQSVIMAFYGYEGPRTYTLEGHNNGGDVRIDFGKNASAWDLPMTPGIACTVNIESDLPTPYTGLDRMKGSFTCPRLISINPAAQHRSITVSEGHFDLFIIVES
ncbi:hypothetical protein KSF_020230 [Reticulibacter mediterranei]|uniref:Uncharacterized protein n=1 Tax=Reticulibacter mediterranei TaxID=2778369 RepID=A0A8J3N162_9CHLR|nr:hypothetical protein [Reticulibacter mediterranei]GHO91975.1 hypothetical protein KSF_020230 [Reticulibacter mediterranei]